MLEQGIPLEAIITELVLSGEVERTMRLRPRGRGTRRSSSSTRRRASTASSPGADAYDDLDIGDDDARASSTTSPRGRFADEWDAEKDAGHAKLQSLKAQHVGGAIEEFELGVRNELGITAIRQG